MGESMIQNGFFGHKLGPTKIEPNKKNSKYKNVRNHPISQEIALQSKTGLLDKINRNNKS